MAKYCGIIDIQNVQGGGSVTSSTVRGNQTVSSFTVPVAIEYQMSIGDTAFKKIRCCEQAMAPVVAENQGNEVCVYTFKQIPRTVVMLGVVSKDGPSYRMTRGRMMTTIFAQIFLAALVCLPLILIPVLGWAAIVAILYFTARYVMELYSSWNEMQKT